MKRFNWLILSLLVLIGLLWRGHRWLLGKLLGLSDPQYHIGLERGLRVPARDGVPLATDHYFPITRQPQPTILVRSPYGRGAHASIFGLYLSIAAHLFAERGYHVLVQDTRGRFDSGGHFDPPFDETDDGLATLDWLRGQIWHNGKVGLWGPSYLGITQWALAPHAPEVKALFPMVTTSSLQDVLFPDNSFDLGLAIRWVTILELLEHSKRHPYLTSPLLLPRVERAIRPAFRHLPLENADAVAVGHSIDYYARWTEHATPDDPLWDGIRERIRLTKGVPVHLVGGWYDFFLRPLLADYATLKAQGERPYLTIGPYHHFIGMATPDVLHEAVSWFDTYLKEQAHQCRQQPVKIYVMGANEWRSLPDWPPPSQPTQFYLQPQHGLLRQMPATDNPPDHYVYNPADPTPIVGGAQFNVLAGAKDNRRLEARPDVIRYTSPELTEPLEIIGRVSLNLYAQSSLTHADFFARLCDVHPDGRSINICDGLFHITPESPVQQPDGTWCLEIDLWATAYRFKPGHRIRLLVASGAHPRWMRNLGTGEAPAKATQMQSARQTIFHDPAHPSALILPVTGGRLR